MIARARIDKFQAFHTIEMQKQLWDSIDEYLCVLLAQEAELTDLIRRDRQLAEEREDGLAHGDGRGSDGEGS